VGTGGDWSESGDWQQLKDCMQGDRETEGTGVHDRGLRLSELEETECSHYDEPTII
jgi:hypothetical protein